jgi:DNA-directed RNA polymerase subunit alpha
MSEGTQDTIADIVSKDTWSAEEHDTLAEALEALREPGAKLRNILSELESGEDDPKGAPALKIGIARYMLCRFEAALDALSNATDNKDRHYFQAMAFKNLRQYESAAEEFERAGSKGWDADEIALRKAECLALAGEPEQVSKDLGKLSGKLGETASYQYVQGLVQELTGRPEEAGDSYAKAIEIDESLASARFRLAYLKDLHGDEEEAVELYRQCVSHPPVHISALLNLAVLYEDAGKYDQACDCCRRILAICPNHLRARLFLRDAEASKSMFYDEDQARRIARRNAVLDIPVTDFELSVRARNCLKKMNIRTLGDLVKITENELLGYKNFGETSLKEIKDMLSAKGLRLGQALEDGGELTGLPVPKPAPEAPGADEGVLSTPIDHIEFSVRARRALDTLGIATLGDLASKSEPDLMSCKNFGQTSLNEIRQRLSEYGLDLRD